MRLFLGIDGGQTSTTALIGDETGRVLGVGKGGPCNHTGTAGGRERFLSAVGESVRQARDRAGLREAEYAAACLGLSGGPEDKDRLAREAVRAGQYLITHDAMIALAGATAGAPGIVIISGTGSMAFGRNAEGRTARAGGWGHIFGDEGSAFHTVRRAVRAALRFEEGWGPPTSLREMFLSRSDSSSVNHLLHRFYTDEYPRDRVASFAPLVSDAAGAGDEVALKLLKGAAQALAVLTAGVRRQLFRPGESVDIRYAGGVFRSEPVLARFKLLAEMEDGCKVSAPSFGPAVGALLEAYRLAGLTVTLQGAPKES
jgi:N-acetylglucosamine kinase-like BadF-type ATPase